MSFLVQLRKLYQSKAPEGMRRPAPGPKKTLISHERPSKTLFGAMAREFLSQLM